MLGFYIHEPIQYALFYLVSFTHHNYSEIHLCLLCALLLLFIAEWSSSLHNQFSSVAQSCPTLPPHRLQHARLPGPSPTPGVHSNSCPMSQWCHLTILSSVVPFSSRLESFPASGSFPMSQLFASGGQSQNWSFSFSISPSNEYSGLISFRMDWLDLLAVQGSAQLSL